MKLIICGAAIAATVAVAGCANAPISAAAVQADAKVAVTTFCSGFMPAGVIVATNLNAQLQADYATVTKACTAIGNGSSVNFVTAGGAAIALYDGLKTTYPKAFTALADHDLVALRRIDPACLRRLK